jgi:hypothetical protein
VLTYLQTRRGEFETLVDASFELLSDVKRLLQAYRIPIESEAVQVYRSGLATMPQCALLDAVERIEGTVQATLLWRVGLHISKLVIACPYLHFLTANMVQLGRFEVGLGACWSELAVPHI